MNTRKIIQALTFLASKQPGYREKYIQLGKAHTYQAICEPNLDEFSESDINALNKVLEAYGSMKATELSEFSHQFPEWTYYQDMLEDKDTKNSYRVNIDHFFEPCDADKSGLFNQSEELLSLTRDLHHQYNRI